MSWVLPWPAPETSTPTSRTCTLRPPMSDLLLHPTYPSAPTLLVCVCVYVFFNISLCNSFIPTLHGVVYLTLSRAKPICGVLKIHVSVLWGNVFVKQEGFSSDKCVVDYENAVTVD